MRIGVVIRDASGGFREALTKRIPSLTSPATAEAMAALNAVIFARDCGFGMPISKVMCYLLFCYQACNGDGVGPDGHLLDEYSKRIALFRIL